MDTQHIPVPTRGSPRVQAWIYTVINPLVESLRRELELVSGGNLTWRSYSGQCEYIRPIRAYISAEDLPNYEDFLADNPEFSVQFGQHDQGVQTVEEKAQNVCDALVRDKAFEETLAKAYAEYESQISREQAQRSSLQGMKERLPIEIAQLLVNGITSLPSHYTVSTFWSEHSGELEKFKAHDSFAELHSAAAELRKNTELLLKTLEDQRLDLCRKYDIPAAPIRHYRSADEDIFSG